MKAFSSQLVCSQSTNRFNVMAVQTPVQNLMIAGVDMACILVIDCPHCGKQKLVSKPDGAGDFDLFCFGEWVPITIETII